MFPLEWLRLFLSWCSLPVLLILVLILTRQKFYRELPLFFSYVAVTAFAGAVRIVMFALTRPPASLPFLRAHPYTYSYVYWASALVMSVFAIVAVYEIFIKRLFTGFYNIRFYRYLFPVVAAAILVFAASTAIFSPDQPWKFISVADRVVVFIRLISLGFFTLLMIVMGRTWTRHELAIVFSFGVIAATNFFASAIWGQNPNTDKNSLLSYVPVIAWDVACVIWLIAFGKPAKQQEPQPIEPIDPGVLEEAKKWEGTLKEWLATPKKKQQ